MPGALPIFLAVASPPRHFLERYHLGCKEPRGRCDVASRCLFHKCEGMTTFPSAVELVGTFLGPALDGSAAGRRWSSDLARWEPGRQVHATENP